MSGGWNTVKFTKDEKNISRVENIRKQMILPKLCMA